MLKRIIDRLVKEKDLTDAEFLCLLNNHEYDEYLYHQADEVRKQYYGNKVYTRGLIEISNICKNDCLYCGIRASNRNINRYRLTKEEIMECCEIGYELGFRTFVMQGGEDLYFTDEVMVDIIGEIKAKYPDCAVTLSLGERSEQSYRKMFEAGADRYLLRHETADCNHYKQLHPEKMNCDKRQECLFNLKKIGYQTGSGFMVGSPYQTMDNIVADLRFLQKLEPDMIGIGPFITHHDTPFSEFKSGSLMLTIKLIAVLRLMFPYVLLPATTALGTIHPDGREMGIRAGANVVMPNLSPLKSRKHYELYDNKISTGEEAAESCAMLAKKLESIGYSLAMERGDVVSH